MVIWQIYVSRLGVGPEELGVLWGLVECSCKIKSNNNLLLIDILWTGHCKFDGLTYLLLCVLQLRSKGIR